MPDHRTEITPAQESGPVRHDSVPMLPKSTTSKTRDGEDRQAPDDNTPRALIGIMQMILVS